MALLCDVLIVCDPHVIIVSVKEKEFNKEGDPATEFARWERKAITSSIKQIRGAERSIESMDYVIRCDGERGPDLPPLDRRIIHRIAVAIGGKGEVTITSGDFDGIFVHVLSEKCFFAILSELDTITDLVEYLSAKENANRNRLALLINGSESNLLAWYLLNDRQFPAQADFMLVEDGIFDELTQRPDYIWKKQADKDSYTWDELIEILSDDSLRSLDGSVINMNNIELSIRVMAKETRLERRLLGRGVYEFLSLAKANKLRSRVMNSNSGITYLLVYFRSDETDACRINELTARSRVARYKLGNGNVIVAIGLSEHKQGKGSKIDVVYQEFPNWTIDDDAFALEIIEKLGLFQNAVRQHIHEDEYPILPSGQGQRILNPLL